MNILLRKQKVVMGKKTALESGKRHVKHIAIARIAGNDDCMKLNLDLKMCLGYTPAPYGYFGALQMCLTLEWSGR
jgi:hypothetical protein